jgi:hypothetical protein
MQAAYGREIDVRGVIGGFEVRGRIDFVLLMWRDGGRPYLRLVECKASRRDRTYHRIQLVLYRLIVQELLGASPILVAGRPLDPGEVEAVVVRIDETTSSIQSILDTPALPLEMEEADVVRLLESSGPLARILQTPLDDLSYRLESKCDDCVFCVHCFPESARQRRLELIGVEPSVARALRDADIQSVDDLADLDLTDPCATAVQRDQTFADSLARLRAVARARRSTLVSVDSRHAHQGYQVEPLPHDGPGQLPPHVIDGVSLVRVYLNVHYDYTENRVVALAAHVTASDGRLTTPFADHDGGRRADSTLVERIECGVDPVGRPPYRETAFQPVDIVEYLPDAWQSRYEADTGAERTLIQTFFRRVVQGIRQISRNQAVPIHFYVWSPGDITALVEACARGGSRLLASLRDLLGCRESLEQLIYSSVEQEVDRRFGLGWTSRGLVVAASLTWFGQTYHWTRRILGHDVDLRQVFLQDLHDFTDTLDLRSDGSWASERERRSGVSVRHRFEIRSRFHDTITAPYWRAIWGTLPDPSTVSDARLRSAIERYRRAARAEYLETYLAARVHALRWIEERIRFKNADIQKPLVQPDDLPDFSLNVRSITAAAVDFLQLDHHVRLTQWLAEHLDPPAYRVARGVTIPLRDVVSDGTDLRATIDVDSYPIDRETLAARTSFNVDSFVRLSPYDGDPNGRQTLAQLRRGGATCVITSLDWTTGEIVLAPRFAQPGRYLLQSRSAGPAGPLFDFATVDDSISDFVAGTVERRLAVTSDSHMNDWLHPIDPRIPPQLPPPLPLQRYESILRSYRSPEGLALVADQLGACLDGLTTRVQLLLGPPGTGKTTTTAVAILLRVLARRRPGDVVLVAANTHTALDTLLQRIDRSVHGFATAVTAAGLGMPCIEIAKLHSTTIRAPSVGQIVDIRSKACIQEINRRRRDAVLILGGTPNALLRTAMELGQSHAFVRQSGGFQTPLLVVDEASMLVFPQFLAVATAVDPDGEIMLSGDHRQLAPIVAHDWEHEDRPPAVLYQPFVSAYEAIQRIASNEDVTPDRVRRSALTYTFRLPPDIRELIARIYRLDDVELEGLERRLATAPEEPPAALTSSHDWEALWQEPHGLFLALHDEHLSKQSNPLEAAVVERILAAAGSLPADSVGVVTPHRAQRTLLSQRLNAFTGPTNPVVTVDTVERFQGGERPVIVVSATASDPSVISASAEFLLDLNRSNVAFSRARERLVVACSESLLTHVPPEVDRYEAAMLWKSLRQVCRRQLFTTTIDGHTIRVYAPPVDDTLAVQGTGHG